MTNGSVHLALSLPMKLWAASFLSPNHKLLVASHVHKQQLLAARDPTLCLARLLNKNQHLTFILYPNVTRFPWELAPWERGGQHQPVDSEFYGRRDGDG